MAPASRGPAGRGVLPSCGRYAVPSPAQAENYDPAQFKKTQLEIEQTLDLVGFYAEKLGDPSFSAQGLTPLVDHLEERMEFLRSVESRPGLPDRVRPIISGLTLTIGTEVAKFRRGDYNT